MSAEGRAAPGLGHIGRATRAVAIVAVVALVALLVYGLSEQSPRTDIDDGLAQAKSVAAPGFELPVLTPGELGELGDLVRPGLANGRLSLEELRGTPVVLNYWASWCVPCRQEAPVLERGWRGARGQGVLFLGLNMQDITDDARAFIREFRNTYPNVRDQSNGVAREWGVSGLPETFFVRADGRIVGHVIGVISAKRLQAGVRAARSGRSLGALEGGDRRPTR